MTETNNNVKNIGLRGVKVADTRVSHVDGTNGMLVYRGYRIEALAERSTFEETAYLLHYDALPKEEQLRDFKKSLEEARELPSFVYDSIRKLPKASLPMDVLQARSRLAALRAEHRALLTQELGAISFAQALRRGANGTDESTATRARGE